MVILGKEIKSMYAKEIKMFYHSDKTPMVWFVWEKSESKNPATIPYR